MSANPRDLYERDKKAREYEGPDRMVSSEEVAKELLETEEQTFKIRTGFKTMDRLLDNVEAGELVIVSGPTSAGKTTMLMSVTQNMAADGIPSAWFTLEVTPRQFIRNMTKKGAVPQFYLPRRDYADVPKEFVEAFEKKNGRPFETIDWVDFKIAEAVTKFGVKAIFIDHIHQIFSLSRISRSRNISLEIGDLAAKVKALAIEYNVVIFLIAHNRDDAESNTREPYMELIRDSGLLIRYADTVIGVWRVANTDDLEIDGKYNNRVGKIGEFDNKTKVAVWKNRREGKRGSFFAYHFNHYLSEDFDYEYQ